MAQETFKRYEKKYLISRAQYEALMLDLKDHVKGDEFKQYPICNLYYDTPHYELIRKSIEKPYYKEKLRLRSYGPVGGDEEVFLEIKKKCDGIVYKRRRRMTLSEAMDYTVNDIPLSEETQIGNELDWFLHRYALDPKVYIAYDREAYVSKEDNRLRITFDRNIRCRETDLDLSKGTEGEMLLDEDLMIMEIKIPNSMALWLVEILSKHKIYPRPFSKYGTYFKQKLTKEKEENVR